MAKPKVVDEKRREVVEEEPPKNLIFEYDPESQNRNSVYEFLSNYIKPIEFKIRKKEEGKDRIPVPLIPQAFIKVKPIPLVALIIILISLLVVAAYQINSLQNEVKELRSDTQNLSNKIKQLNASLENASSEAKNMSSLNMSNVERVLSGQNKSNQTNITEGIGLNDTNQTKRMGEVHEGNYQYLRKDIN